MPFNEGKHNMKLAKWFKSLDNILHGHGLCAEDFMHMQTRPNSSGGTTHSFKDIETRDYLYLVTVPGKEPYVAIPRYREVSFKHGEYFDRAKVDYTKATSHDSERGVIILFN